MKHRHHIIPKHAGGTDDPSNLIELTVEEHAKAHYILWNQHGRWQDKVAWKVLSKMIDKTEVISQVLSESNKARWRNPTYREKMARLVSQSQKKLWEDPNFRETQLENLRNRNFQSIGTIASRSPKSRQKQRDTFKIIGHQQGEKNSMYGKMWITNGSRSYRIDKTDSIPEGYRKGRVLKS